MTTTARNYSDDKIFVAASNDHLRDTSSASQLATLEQHSDEKIAAPHDEKILSQGSTSVSDEKVLTTSSKSTPPASDDKQVVGHGSSEQKILAPSSLDTVPAEKIPAVEPDFALTTQRATTDASQTSQTRSAPRVYREYGFHHTSTLKLNHNVIVDPNGQAMYLAAVSGFAKGREDVVLHSIADGMAAKGTNLTAEEGKTCAGVAFAQFPHKKPNLVQLALGSSSHMNQVKWYELSRSSETDDWRLMISNGPNLLRLRLSTTNATKMGSDSPVSASPHSAHDDGKSTLGSFIFVDSGLGIALASYTEQKTMTSWKKRGKLRIYDRAFSDVNGLREQEMEQLVVLCCAVLNEKRRRSTLRKWTGMGVF